MIANLLRMAFVLRLSASRYHPCERSVRYDSALKAFGPTKALETLMVFASVPDLVI
jgi:hypothetical protein